MGGAENDNLEEDLSLVWDVPNEHVNNGPRALFKNALTVWLYRSSSSSVANTPMSS